MSTENSGKKTYIINLFGGPGIGKTTLSALIFAKLKTHQNKYIVEYIQEYAKQLVWTKNFEVLNNQYHVTQHQYNLLKQIDTKVDFVVTDGPLCQGLYYNRFNKDNMSNVDKTENFILEKHAEFNNINLFLQRGDFEYESQGRLQTAKESKEIDTILSHLLEQNNIKTIQIASSSEEDNINNIIKIILENCI